MAVHCQISDSGVAPATDVDSSISSNVRPMMGPGLSRCAKGSQSGETNERQRSSRGGGTAHFGLRAPGEAMSPGALRGVAPGIVFTDNLRHSELRALAAVRRNPLHPLRALDAT